MKYESTSPRRWPAYRVDLVAAGMFAGAFLDTWTTWLLVSGHYGVEMNPILAPLTRCSLIWIPIYLLCRPVLVPFAPEICRLAFGVYFGLAGFLSGINNLAGILCSRYVLVDAVGFPVLQGMCVLLAIVVFIWWIWKRASNAQERKQQLLIGLGWTGIFLLLELGFFAAGKVMVKGKL